MVTLYCLGHTRRVFPIAACLAACFVALLAVACSRTPESGAAQQPGSGGGAKGALRVVCTTGMIADAAREIGAERVDVTQLMGEGVDPHLYRASPGDMRLIRGANVVLSNGLHLEGRMGEILAAPGKGIVARAAAEAIDPEHLMRPPEFEGQYDPHVWFDVSLWKGVVAAVRDALIEGDAEGREHYDARAGAYLSKLDELHAWCAAELGAIPRERRVLITAHDAFGYFGRAYDIEVKAIQGVSTDSEAGVRDVNRLVDLIVQRGVPAVFVESSVPPRMIEALVEGCRARGHEVRVGGELFSDAMGASGTPEGTYIGMVRHNVRTIVDALGGSERR